MSRLKLEFNHNTAALSAGIVQEGLVNSLADFFQQSDTIFSRINILEGIKSSTLLPKVATNAELQKKTGCGFTANGTTAWSDRTLAVTPVYTNEEYCAESLVGKWTEMLLSLGLNGQNEEVTPEAVIVAMHAKNFMYKNWDAFWNGDAGNAGLSPHLQHYDGALKIINAALTSIHVNYVAITDQNAHLLVEKFASVIPEYALENNVMYEIRTSRANVVKVRNNLWRHKDYQAMAANIDMSQANLEMILPVSGFKLVSDRYLADTELIAIPLNNAFVGTDAEADMQLVDSKYDAYNEKLRVTVQARVGFQTNAPENWVIMSQNIPVNAATSPVDLSDGTDYCHQICS